MKKVVILCALALLAGCTAAPAPIVVRTSRVSFGAGDSLGKDLHRTDSAVAEAQTRDRAFAVHPD